MAGIDQRIKANVERAQADQGALPFDAEQKAPPRIEDTADQAQPPKALAKSSHHCETTARESQDRRGSRTNRATLKSRPSWTPYTGFQASD